MLLIHENVLVSYTTLGINDANIKQGVLAAVAFLILWKRC